MIEAAERLAAERGLGALTVQGVQQAAGQRNKSAVSYHFGSMQGLVDALVAHRMAPANERRSQMLLALGEQPTATDLVEVLVRPLAESVLGRSPSYWARFLLQALGDPEMSAAALAAADDQALRVAQDRLVDRLDHLPEPVRRLRVLSIFGYAAVVLAAHEVGLTTDLDIDDLTGEIVDACCALVGVPPRTPTAP